MNQQCAPLSVIVLLDGSPSADNKVIKRWFERSHFLTCEANDIFQVLEDLSDFTTTQRPDVVLLEVKSVADDFLMVQKLSQALLGDDDLPILVYSDQGDYSDAYFSGNLVEIEDRLNLMLPTVGKVSAAIAA